MDLMYLETSEFLRRHARFRFLSPWLEVCLIREMVLFFRVGFQNMEVADIFGSLFQDSAIKNEILCK